MFDSQNSEHFIRERFTDGSYTLKIKNDYAPCQTFELNLGAQFNPS